MAQQVIIGGNVFWVEDNSPENPLPAILVSALQGLTDVDLTSPADGDTLVYNATSHKWENGAPSGGGSDPLELANWLSVGAPAAQSGAVRLEEGGAVTARVPDYSAGSGMAAEDFPLMALVQAETDDGPISVMRLGKLGVGPDVELIFDYFYNNGAYLLGGRQFILTEATTYAPDSDDFAHAAKLALSISEVSLVASRPDEGFGSNPTGMTFTSWYHPTSGALTPFFGHLRPVVDDGETGAGHFSLSPDGIKVWSFHRTGAFQMPGTIQSDAWPSEDPSVGGQAWNNAGLLVVSGSFAKQANVPDPTGAATDQDDEARAAIVSLRDALIAAGLMEPAA